MSTLLHSTYITLTLVLMPGNAWPYACLLPYWGSRYQGQAVSTLMA